MINGKHPQKISIAQWPEDDRPREKLLTRGAENLSNAELLAIIFSTGIKGKTALDLARELLNSYPDLRKLFNADYHSFVQQHGMGFAKYCQLQAAVELGKRYLQESVIRHGIISRARDVKDFLIARLRDLEQEVFACLFLDSQNQIIAFEKLFKGGLNSTRIHPREVVKRALHHNAAAVILAHNHPSGNPEPSLPDRQLTSQLKEALILVEIALLDHIIVGNPNLTSFAETGLL